VYVAPAGALRAACTVEGPSVSSADWETKQQVDGMPTPAQDFLQTERNFVQMAEMRTLRQRKL